MRKELSIVCASVIALLCTSIVLAQELNGIYVSDNAYAGDELDVFANVKNDADENIGRARVVAYLPELDIYEKSDPFFMSKKVNYGRMMHVGIPEDTLPGEYIVRVSLFANGKMKHQWRTVIIE